MLLYPWSCAMKTRVCLFPPMKQINSFLAGLNIHWILSYCWKTISAFLKVSFSTILQSFSFSHLDTTDTLFLTTDLSRKIMRGIALALGGPVDAFEGTIAGDPFWGIRLVSYPGLVNWYSRRGTRWYWDVRKNMWTINLF